MTENQLSRINPALFRGSNRRFALILYGIPARPQEFPRHLWRRALQHCSRPTRNSACFVDVA